MDSTNSYTASSHDKATMGRFGERHLTTGETSVAGETFAAIQVLEASVISYTNLAGGGDASQSSLTVPVGITLVGPMTTINVVSGSVLAKLG